MSMMPTQNPHEDRITQILKSRAQPQNFNYDQIAGAGNAAIYSALGGGNQGVEQILDALFTKPRQEQQQREFESAKGLYDMFEEKRASGDKQAQALFDKINLFTGGDPEGTAMFVEALHSDPESIDPGNSFQVMSKLAGIAKKSGYQSPASKLSALDIEAKRATIDATRALAKQRAEGGGSKLPASIILANEIDKARESGDIERLNDLLIASKSLEKGQGLDASGNIINLGGYTNTLSEAGSAEEFGKSIGKKTGEALIEERGKAREAQQTMSANAEARRLLDSGAITGTGAKFLTGMGKALQQAGVNFAEDEIANTEAFVANRAAEVGRVIKLFGAGTGLSDADREYAEKAAAGQIQLTEASIRKILDISDRAAQRAIEVFNEELGKAPAAAMPYDLSVDAPQAPADDAVDWQEYFK